MLLYKTIHYGKYTRLYFISIVMDFSDDGDLYQKIVQLQKTNTTFD